MSDTLTQKTQEPVIIEKKRAPRYRAYMGTWNNYDDDDLEYAKEKLTFEGAEWYINEEEAPTTGTPHLQMAWRFENARSWDKVKEMFPQVAKLQNCKDWNKARQYCKKTATAIAHHSSYDNLFKLDDPFEGLTMKYWQIELLDYIKTKPDKRTVRWYYDDIGGCGKTTLAKKLCIDYPDEILYMGGKANDVKYGITSFIYDKKTGERIRNLRVVIFDFTRSTENFVSYQAIEEVKNGIFYNNKYESRMVTFNHPHVIIFSNFAPDRSKLSDDRWDIIDLAFED